MKTLSPYKYLCKKKCIDNKIQDEEQFPSKENLEAKIKLLQEELKSKNTECAYLQGENKKINSELTLKDEELHQTNIELTKQFIPSKEMSDKNKNKNKIYFPSKGQNKTNKNKYLTFLVMDCFVFSI